jgi:hypothetical protein
MNNTLKTTLAVVSIGLASVATVALHAQAGAEDQDVYVAVYKKAAQLQACPAAPRDHARVSTS